MSSARMLLSLLILSIGALPSPSSASIGSRSILRAVVTNAVDKPDIGVDLNATNFDTILRDTPATYAIVEFFAHWCPACRNYKPQFEKVARLFNGPNAVHPGIILMARVDCASKINNDLCDKFSVDHYPMLLWGPPAKFVGSGWKPNQEKSDIISIDKGRTAVSLLNWINKQLGSSYGLDDEKYENEHLHSNISDPGQIARALYDVEEATSTAFDIIMEHKMIKLETRASLIKFFQLLVAHHPSRRCRKGSAEFLVNFDDLYPRDSWSSIKQEPSTGGGKGILENFHICGKDVPRGYWMFCRGSRNDTRGFSCGLWVLMHSLSVRVDDGESQMAFTSICEFINNFFICEECRQHFHSMCSSVSTPFKKTQDFVLWLWDAHNKVNERLIIEESSPETGDPKFPKSIWPSRQLCPSCKNNNKWNHDEVYKFLVKYYGSTLVSLDKSTGLIRDSVSEGVAVEDSVGSTNAIVVPLGAALGIAVASCIFGALACYWRSRQKNRKYKHHLHSLKNI